MMNQEAGFERDPHLRRNDSLTQKTTSTSGNQWEVAMKGVPSFSEHMKQLEGRNAGNKNAFYQSSKKQTLASTKTNAFTKAVSSGQNSHREASNNAFSRQGQSSHAAKSQSYNRTR